MVRIYLELGVLFFVVEKLIDSSRGFFICRKKLKRYQEAVFGGFFGKSQNTIHTHTHTLTF